MKNIKNLIVGDHRDAREDIETVFPVAADASGSETSEVLASKWARDVLAAENVAAENQVAAVAAIRKAEPRLSLKSAVFIAKTLDH